MSPYSVYSKIAEKRLGYCALQLEITSTCFQDCPTCFAKRVDTKASWSLGDAMRLFDELARMPTFEHLTFTGGDPQAWAPMPSLIRYWKEELNKPFRIAYNTAMMRSVEEQPEIRDVNLLRLSLDGISPEVYKRCRGVTRSPREAIRWTAEAGVPFAIFTCLSSLNKDDLFPMAQYLVQESRTNPAFKKFKRWSIAPMIGTSDDSLYSIFQAYRLVEEYIKAQKGLPFVCAVDSDRLLNFYNERNDAFGTPPCWVSYVSCHIKADKHVYPCCLIGGEATAAERSYCIGDFSIESLGDIYKRYTSNKVPSISLHCSKACRNVCQLKQHTFNRTAEAACEIEFSMP